VLDDQPFGQVEPGLARRHPVVEHDGVGTQAGHQRLGLGGVHGAVHLVALEPQVRQGEVQRVGVIVSDHHERHATSSHHDSPETKRQNSRTVAHDPSANRETAAGKPEA
jgi:hypothetical protein